MRVRPENAVVKCVVRACRRHALAAKYGHPVSCRCPTWFRLNLTEWDVMCTRETCRLASAGPVRLLRRGAWRYPTMKALLPHPFEMSQSKWQ